MALPAVAGQNLYASDLWQLCRPSGGVETGHYFLGGGVYTNNATQSCYIPSQSRGATPLSVTFDTADQAPAGGMGTVAIGQLTAGGFQVYSITSTAGTNPRAGGNYTEQF